MNWGPIILSLKLASITTFCLFFISLPISYFLAYKKFKLKAIVESVISLPLVLPPTVLGFYYLLVFNPSEGLGKFLNNIFDIKLVFTFEGLVLASMIYSLPFMVQPLQSGFQSIPQSYREAAQLMGKNRWTIMRSILLPNMTSSILTGIILSFAHTIGEFGVVLMIGGNIPDETNIASIAVYDAVESMQYGIANQYALTLLLICFTILFLVYFINGKVQTRIIR